MYRKWGIFVAKVVLQLLILLKFHRFQCLYVKYMYYLFMEFWFV